MSDETKMNIEEFRQQMNKSSTIPLSISNNIIKYGGTVYPIKNISYTSVVEKEVSSEKWNGLPFIAIGVVLFLLGFGYFLFFIFSIVLFIFGAKSYKTNYQTFYGLVLQTNSGSSELFFSADKDFIIKISDLIIMAMEDSGNINQTINIGEQIFHDNSTNIKHEEHNYISNFHLNVTHHHGLSKEDLAFLTNDFTNILTKLDKQFNDIKEEKGREEIKKIIEEINSDKPRPSAIKKAYEKAKAIAEANDMIENLGKVGTAIASVITMFT